MSTTTNDATTWRDLADQLTAEQIRELERLDTIEQSLPHPRGAAHHRLGQLVNAESWVKDNTRRADMTIPAGAVWIDDWADTQTMTPHRCFNGPRHVIPGTDAPWSSDIEVWGGGTQYQDGPTQRLVFVNQLHADNPITVDQAEQLAATLIEVAKGIRATTD